MWETNKDNHVSQVTNHMGQYGHRVSVASNLNKAAGHRIIQGRNKTVICLGNEKGADNQRGRGNAALKCLCRIGSDGQCTLLSH